MSATTPSSILVDNQSLCLEILTWLDTSDLLACSQVSRNLHELLLDKKRKEDNDHIPCGNFLWFCLYCSKYRSCNDDFVNIPSSFEKVLAATAITKVAPLQLEDFHQCSWRELVIRRDFSARAFLVRGEGQTPGINRGNLRGGHRLAMSISASLPTNQVSASRERRGLGIVDVIHAGGENTRNFFLGMSRCSCLVMERHVRDMVLPFSRPIAFYIRGGASCGLVSRNWELERALRKHVGWARGSIGYHGDCGHIYCCSGWRGIPFGPTFGYDPKLVTENNETDAPLQPDVIGVGVELSSEEGSNRKVFYTKNGSLIGTVTISRESSDIDIADSAVGFASDTYCHFAICLHDSDDFCSINFGTKRFLFDIEKYSSHIPPSFGRSTVQIPNIEL